MRAQLSTGGEQVAVTCQLPWVADRLVEAADGRFEQQPAAPPTIRVLVESSSKAFPTAGLSRLSRDAWAARGQVVVRDVVTSGFDLHLRWQDSVPEMAFRWRPPMRTGAAAVVLRSRARLLLRAALLQFPVLWVAATRGRAPVHACASTAGPLGPALLVGPSGVGKTTLVEQEVRGGGRAATDNLGIGDGETVWGVVEPLRSEQGHGKPAPHGRREMTLPHRVDSLRPRLLVVLRRGAEVRVARCDPQQATRALVASTYAAGELRRYWSLHALLALGTGMGPAHPPVNDVAAAFASRSQCLTVDLPHVHGVRIAEVLATEGATTWM
jgi:hypothetical protein